MSSPVILWFRNDLRLADHRALAAAIACGQPVIPLFILDDTSPGRWRRGGASRWWLEGSLAALASSLAAVGSRLVLRRGESSSVLAEIARETSARCIYFSRAYEPWAVALEVRIKRELEAAGVASRRFGGALLFEPESARTREGAPFHVFTPFWRAVQALPEPKPPLAPPQRVPEPNVWPASDRLADWGLRSATPGWAAGLRASWQPGEAGASRCLDHFLSQALESYAALRDQPDVQGTSRLSPHLHFGEVSPAQCWHAARAVMAASSTAATGATAFLRQLGWREFSNHLLSHRPDLPERAFRRQFEGFRWRQDDAGLAAWQRGLTGYPIVDAGMRELWTSGWMHNRVRMIAASFLIKDLLVPWQDGAGWFWDTLVDADLANNSASWQWVAGSGADAAPYFRIFNPIKQGRTFDPHGGYIRRWLPELSRLPDDALHFPADAPAFVLEAAGVRLGKNYPLPIVDHAVARQRALAVFAEVRGAGSKS